MRLWHKDLIPFLPRQQLLSQWRECCCIAHDIMENGTPGHILVNPIMDYTIQHFITYTYHVTQEMQRRGYNVNKKCFEQYWKLDDIIKTDLFPGWHNDRYLCQCYYNLQEKYDRGGLTEDEWKAIDNNVKL